MKTQLLSTTLMLTFCCQPALLLAEHHEEIPRIAPRQTANSILPMPKDNISSNADKNADRKALFGDLHVHTKYSFDAYAFGTLATPYDAYRYAKGEAIKHPGGFDVKMRAPLDFYAVTDHAMFLGLVEASADTSTAFSKTKPAQPLHNLNAAENLTVDSIPQRTTAFRSFLPSVADGITSGEITVDQVESVGRTAWADTVKAADQHNQPGTFTTFAAYEYTSSTDEMGNLHRNVIFRGTDKLPAIPFSRFHSQNPELLWDWMDDLREQGIESLAIPHNSNGSNGAMFEMVDWAKNPIDDAYADRRLRNEPLVEITQVKGTSDTHPSLSAEDEWADFEIMPYRVATTLPSAPPGSYVRDAYLRGLKLAEEGTANPYRFGLVGASDTHTAAISIDESNFFAKIGLLDSNGVLRGSLPVPESTEGDFRSARDETYTDDQGRVYSTGGPESWGASGLAAVWAEENTRESIYDAFRRKETFATTGPRIKVRLFAGYDYNKKMLKAHDVFEQAYAGGVTMGNDLIPDGQREPEFLAWATRDASSAPLQRLQIIKGWRENGESHEQVYDVACSKGKPNKKTHRCKDNGAKVDISTCAISGAGAAELKTVWKDPDFDPSQRAFYYVRALENPTCRWSTWDAVHAGVEPRQDLQKTLQERAWSSPIWYAVKD